MKSGDTCPKCEFPPELSDLAGRLCRYDRTKRWLVYFLVHNGTVIYVGQTMSIQGRIDWHAKLYPFDEVLYFEVDQSEVNDVETYWIRRLMPPLNRKKTGRKYHRTTNRDDVCPACKCAMRIRTSRRASDNWRRQFLECPECEYKNQRLVPASQKMIRNNKSYNNTPLTDCRERIESK